MLNKLKKMTDTYFERQNEKRQLLKQESLKNRELGITYAREILSCLHYHQHRSPVPNYPRITSHCYFRNDIAEIIWDDTNDDILIELDDTAHFRFRTDYDRKEKETYINPEDLGEYDYGRFVQMTNLFLLQFTSLRFPV